MAESTERAEKLFRDLDKDSSGQLSKSELVEAMRSMPNFEKLYGVDAITMEELDCNHNNKLSMEEFVTFFKDKMQAALGAMGENFRLHFE